jgi:superfamily II DNA/RNA helicase
MFDNQTRNLILASPPLPELDGDRLPEELTSAFVEITSTRLILSDLSDSERNDLLNRLLRLRRLANTYASYVALGVAEAQTASSAFVAGTAFRLLGEAATIKLPIADLDNELDHDSVSDWILAIVLFLIAGYPADSLATAKAMKTSAQPPSQQAAASLWQSLAAFGEGRLTEVITISESAKPLTIFELNQQAHPDDLAVELMWSHLAQGLSLLVSRMLGLPSEELSIEETPRMRFERVRDLAYQSYDVRLPITMLSADGTTRSVPSTFSGPYLLASLLMRLSDDIETRAVINTPSPPEIDENAWRELLKNIATDRPFLWENHLDAIQKGYLEKGVSSVLSFPTGAGKSTLAELKIGTHLLSASKVIYVAPTHALASQVRRNLRKTFPDYEVRDSLIGDGYYSEVGEDNEAALSDVTVMTPERCLMLLELYPNAFRNVRLFVMDECHLLHPSSGTHDRRALDTMLCLLRLTDLATGTDVVLLSAMMANAGELASWLQSILDRKCLPLDLTWKPTRQARGCLVYPTAELKHLGELILKTKNDPKRTTKNPPVSLKKRLEASPIGLFCLQQNWITNANDDYKACSLSSSKMPIDIDQSWRWSTGKNDIAARLAAGFARQNVKTIVFSQNKKHCESIAAKIEQELAKTQTPTALTTHEERLMEAAIEEVGDRLNSYIPLPHGVVCHHRLLTSLERRLAEGMFEREDGANVIVATPTLAQGMNLPAQAVVLAGERRFDQAHETISMIEAHELLNAAGRAGRAGFHPEGIVLLVPDKPISFDSTKYEIGQAWFRLKDGIFAKGDNCLTINDPIELLLDELQNSAQLNPGILTYFVNRLPVTEDEEGNPVFAPTEKLLTRSLAAYRARLNGNEANFLQRISLAASQRKQSLHNSSAVDWADRLAAANGISSQSFTALATALEDIPESDYADTPNLSKWLIRLLISNRRLADELVRRDSVRAVLGKQLVPDRPSPWPQQTLEHVGSLAYLWLTGQTLVQIESAIANIRNTKAQKYCTRARELSQGAALDLSFALGLLPQVWRASKVTDTVPISIGVAGACMRRGLSSPERLALSMIVRSLTPEGEQPTRPQINRLFGRIAPYLNPRLPEEQFIDTKRRVETALLTFEMLGLTDRNPERNSEH